MRGGVLLVAASAWAGACGGDGGQAAGERHNRAIAAVADETSPACEAPDAIVALDHVVVAVRDLERAAADYRDLGFTLKPGRLHANGLLNAHAKLRDSTEIELMSLAEPPGDRMARGYAAFLEGGEGGAYLALRADGDAIRRAARDAGLEARSPSGIYVGLESVPNVFALGALIPPADPDSIFAHANGAAALRVVWIEGGESLERLLLAAGAVRCGPLASPAGLGSAEPGGAYALARGRVVVLPPRDPARPVVRGVTLAGEGASRRATGPDRAHGIFIAWEAE